MPELDSLGDDHEFLQLSLNVGLEPSAPEQSWPKPYYDSLLSQHSFDAYLKNVSAEERPRDRLFQMGASALSTGELLAILLGTGLGAGKLSALDLGLYLLHVISADGVDPFQRLREITVEELTAVPGIGLAKATTIVAAVELGKRTFLPRLQRWTVIDDPGIAAEALAQDLMWQSQERFAVVLLDVKHRLLGTHVVSIGTATETLAHPRDVFRIAIRQNATRIILAHNHPSGAVEPSSEDLALTKQFLQAASVLGLPVLDHLILGTGQYCSLRATTNLWCEYPQE